MAVQPKQGFDLDLQKSGLASDVTKPGRRDNDETAVCFACVVLLHQQARATALGAAAEFTPQWSEILKIRALLLK